MPHEAKLPFSGILDVLWDDIRRSEVSVTAWDSEEPLPKSLAKKVKALRAMERILVGIEIYWDKAPKSPMSIKDMIAQFEAQMISPPGRKTDA